jgi:hypothetical protein
MDTSVAFSSAHELNSMNTRSYPASYKPSSYGAAESQEATVHSQAVSEATFTASAPRSVKPRILDITPFTQQTSLTSTSKGSPTSDHGHAFPAGYYNQATQ